MFKPAHTSLYNWYAKNGRHDLPWRRSDDPYRIWLSEIMLQQTQVKTVLERFYFPFLEAFPTLQDLADADVDEVLKKWEGLGYYTRARNLHKTAQLVAPTLPQSIEELKALPGIGQSTAHAVAAFAYHTPVPLMDANVKRILYRVFGLKQATDKALWEYAYRLFDEEHPFDFNQAMMDLGALLCLPKKVQCGVCPFQSVCKGTATDPLLFPEKKVKKKTPIRCKQIIIYSHNGRYALKQRSTRFLHGLWGFHEPEHTREVDDIQHLGAITQIYSHFRLEADVYVVHHEAEGFEWFSRKEIESLALSRADHKALALLA